MMIPRDDTGRETPIDGCAAFEATLPDYLDDALAPDVAREAAAHVAGCATCRDLVRDLREVRAEARALPVLRPSRDLWQGIEARIAPHSAASSDTPVANAAARRSAARMTAMQRWFGPEFATRVVALAASLVIATAGITYMATRLVEIHSPPSGGGVEGPMPGPVSARTVAQTSEYIYDAQITSLHQILEQRRSRLDPKTVAVIEHNLAVIDTAIAQSKQALKQDPANAFLADQLDRDLNTKLELLRTVALLPSRT